MIGTFATLLLLSAVAWPLVRAVARQHAAAQATAERAQAIGRNLLAQFGSLPATVDRHGERLARLESRISALDARVLVET
jgi:hypothetical protein